MTNKKLKYQYNKYKLELPNSCYIPSEDTFLLLETLQKNIKKYNSALEIGVGSGVISLYLYDFVKNIDCCDINREVVEYLKNIKKENNLKINIYESYLFKELKKKYDLIVFNPPYVPSEKVDVNDVFSLATDGGVDGVEIINEFIENVYDWLKDNGDCFLLVSSLNNIKNIKNKCLKNKLNVKIINTKKLFFEELYILQINKM
jgi:release factor glutamine methyltransferase